MKRLARRAVSVAWPAFLCAAVLEIAVFAFVDPQALQLLNGSEMPLSDTATYSLAFFVFWAIAAAGGFLTLILHGSAEEVNAQPVSGS
jgi:hypothetical protein